MEFSCISRFSDSFDKLSSKKSKYGCLPKNIFKRFNGKSLQELFDSGFSLNGGHPIARLIKYRIQSCNNAGKSSGFRVIAFVNLKKKTFHFLEVYPKTGPDAKSNVDKEERSEFLKELKIEINSLQPVFFHREDEIIEIKKP